MRVNSGEAVQQTATIYQFPLQRRKPQTAQHEAVRASRETMPVMTSSWYHDEAIEDAKRGH